LSLLPSKESLDSIKRARIELLDYIISSGFLTHRERAMKHIIERRKLKEKEKIRSYII